jgi:flagellar basal-body rod protein FlgB
MDWSTTSPFGVIKERLAWLGQRQQVLARNIANADTPGYVPHDLEPLRFQDMLHRSAVPVRVATTDPGHLGGSARPATEFVEREQRDMAEATPAGNAVDLEEQMAKVTETAVSHKLTTQLYRKYLGLVRMAASARG